MNEERRRFTRVPFDSHCVLRHDGATFKAQLLDISLKGALIEIEDASIFVPERRCELGITLSGSVVVMDVDVQMVHNKENQIGLYFVGIDIDSLTHLRKLIELNMGDADKTLQELFLWMAS